MPIAHAHDVERIDVAHQPFDGDSTAFCGSAVDEFHQIARIGPVEAAADADPGEY